MYTLSRFLNGNDQYVEPPCRLHDGEVQVRSNNPLNIVDSHMHKENGVENNSHYNPNIEDVIAEPKNSNKILASPDSYNAQFDVELGNIKKVSPKFIAKSKVFNKKTKVKKYAVTLKTIKNTWIALIKAKTNNKGKATFKITKLNKKDKCALTIKFKGNKNYKSLAKKVKFVVR